MSDVEGGTFFLPTVLGEATSDMLIASEETFGPVAPLFRFEGLVQTLPTALFSVIFHHSPYQFPLWVATCAPHLPPLSQKERGKLKGNRMKRADMARRILVR